MAISKNPLGINARNFLYIRRYNHPSAKKTADNKLESKMRFLKSDIQTPNILYIFETRRNIKEFNWDLPAEGFVIKPARGYEGEGILVFNSWDGEKGKTIFGRIYDKDMLQSHILDIFEGVYSLQSLPDIAYIEEKITPDNFFRKLTPLGLPDMRIIVFNKVPVMAMLRLPTQESEGKANINQGALGLGVDLKTGITVHAIIWDKQIFFIPSTKIKTRGIKIPNWEEYLALAIKAQTVSGLGYAGVDIISDAKRGLQVLEINARPGLSIQNANLASLRSRLERVENLNIDTIDRGIEIAKSLFAQDFAEKINISPKVLSLVEKIKVSKDGSERIIEAKIDSGAYRTSIDQTLVDELNLTILSKKILIKAATGQQLREVVKFEFFLNDKKISTMATVAKRSHLKYPVIVGRKDLKGYLINPNLDDLEEVEEEIYLS